MPLTEDEYARKIWEEEQRKLAGTPQMSSYLDQFSAPNPALAGEGEAQLGQSMAQRSFEDTLSQRMGPRLPRALPPEATSPMHHNAPLASDAGMSLQVPEVPSDLKTISRVNAENLATGKLPKVAEQRKLGETAPTPGGTIAENVKSYLEAKRRNRLMRGAGEGLLLAGKGLSGIGGFNVDIGDGIGPTVAEQETEDFIPQEQRDWFREQTGIELPQDMSMSRMEQLFPTMFKAMQASTATDMAERKQSFYESSRRNLDTRMVVKDFDAKVEKARTGIEALVNARKQLDSANSVAQAAAAIKAARASGEVGPLTESDKAPFQNRMGIIRQIEDSLARNINGQFTPELKNELIGLMDMWQNTINASIQSVEDETAKRWYKDLGYKTPDEFRESKLRGREMLSFGQNQDEAVVDQLPEGWSMVEPGIAVDAEGTYYQVEEQ